MVALDREGIDWVEIGKEDSIERWVAIDIHGVPWKYILEKDEVELHVD